MKMKRIIKITESQLRETEGKAFEYLDITDDTTPNNGQSSITPQGKEDEETNGEPLMTDRVGKQRSPQIRTRQGSYMNGNIRVEEGVSLADSDNDGVDDYYENVGDMGGLDTLSDGDDDNNLTVIPKSVENKLNLLLQSLKNLSPRQKAMVVNVFMEQIDISAIPNAWKKELMYKVLSNKDNPNKNDIK